MSFVWWDCNLQHIEFTSTSAYGGDCAPWNATRLCVPHRRYLKQPLPTSGRPTSPTAKPPMQTSRVWHITVLPGTKQNSPSPPHPSSCSDVCVVRSSGSTTFLHVGNTGRGAYTSCCMGSSHSSSAKRWLRAGTCRRHSSPSLHGFLSASCVLQSPGRSNWFIIVVPPSPTQAAAQLPVAHNAVVIEWTD